ncbi:MAG: oxygen-independent coproporphyrinogen III oxidase [Gammaproteobacteria bacterium]|nr:oxygen-independent coproporphyrinogen III oxidase [Gammaproteobacteria bacterium]
MQAVPVSFELINKYGLAGPRYTSYPSALQFADGFQDSQYLQDVKAQQDPISVYIHLPFCHTMCWFCGCNKIVTRKQDKADRYLDYLAKEMLLWRGQLQHVQVSQIHFGGGTPNFLTPKQIDRLNALLRCYLPITPDVKISVELSPDWLTKEQVLAFARLGAKRASIGVQDTSPVVQEAVNRPQPMACNHNAVKWLREAGFTSINVDLIYGLPHQTRDSFKQTIQEVLELEPDRFALFNYAHVPWFKPTQKVFASDIFPDPMAKLDIFQDSRAALESAGYTFIGLDHFAKADDELTQAWNQGKLQRDFQGYSVTESKAILGIGLSSVSQSPKAYRQNHKDLSAYEAALDAGQLPLSKGVTLTADDDIRRTVINRLMCQLELDFAALSKELNIDFTAYFASSLQDMQALIDDEIVALTDTGLVVTELGRLFLRNIAMQFDAYREKQTGRCSQTL